MAATRKALISYEELKYTRSAQATGSEREAELNRSATSQFRGISEIHSSVDRSLLSVLGGLPGLGKSTTRQSSDTITLDGGERDHGSELDIEGDASLQFTSLMEHMRNSSVMSVSGPSSPFSRHKVDKAEEADMVLFQFESSFVSLAQSAMSLVGGNLGATNQVTHANAGAKPYSVHSASQIKESQNNRDSRNQISSLSESVPAPGEESSMSFSCYLEAHSQSVSSTSGNLLNKNSEGTVSNTLADRSYHEDDTEEEGDVDSMMPSAVNNISEALNTYNSAPAAAPAIQPTSDTAGSTSSGADAALMSMFLDKYSDKLVDLLSDKIKAKLQQDGNSTLSSSASSIGTL